MTLDRKDYKSAMPQLESRLQQLEKVGHELTNKFEDIAHQTQLQAAEAEKKEKVVERVAKIAGNTNQYFWHVEEGTDTGAHITKKPKEEFLDNPQNGGGNLLARSNGIAVRDGLTELAVFGANGVQIGQTGESRLEIDYHSLQMIDGDTNPHVFFHISDLRDENNEYEYTEEFIGTGYTRRFPLLYIAKRDKELSVTVSDGSGGEAYLDSSVASTLWFETAPTDGAKITVSYITSSYFAKAYTLGMRKNNSDIGPLSTCFGLDNIASGSRSFAVGWNTEATGAGSHSEGYGTKANGNYSHAQGYKTIANRAYQVAIGEFNEIDNYNISFGTRGQYAFIIGNGIDDDNRSNALTVDWDGNVELAGTVKNLIVTNRKSTTLSLPASNTATASINMAKAGYTLLGIVGVQTTGSGSSLGYIYGFYVSENTAYVHFRNTTGTARSYTVTVTGLYVKS